MDLTSVVAELGRRVPDLIAVYRFGSTARGDARPDSDVDLAFLAAAPMPSDTHFELVQAIESILHRTVDLIDLRAASAVLRIQVLEGGILVDDRDTGRRETFEAFALSDYARLNEERAAILGDIARTGRVHG